MTTSPYRALVTRVRQAARTGRKPATTAGKFVWSRVAMPIMVLMLAGGGAIVWAQAPALPASVIASPASSPAPAEAETHSVRLSVGRSTVVDAGLPITRVSVTSAEVADVLVTSPNQLLVNGKAPGTISMFVWDRTGALRRYEVTVERDLARLSGQLKELFPSEKIQVQSNGRNVVLSGSVSSKDVMEKVVNLAAGYVERKEEVVTLMQLSPTAPSNQVLLRVRFAEVSRNALTELGASFFTSPLGINNTLGRVSTNQFAAPGFENLEWTKEGLNFGDAVTSAKGEFAFSDFLNLFLFNQQYDLGLMVKALQTRGVFQSLAEPNLVAESGKEASFLAGGEIPVPIAQGGAGNLAVSVTYKEYGIRLGFTPTVTDGGRIRLKVKPEVSTLDFGNAVLLNGFRIPALTTRRAETELELQNGQTFAIAGLMSNQVSNTMQKIPGIGDIPILGYLFKSKAAQKNQTELVVIITPTILPNNSNGVTPNLPRMQEPYLPPLPPMESFPAPPPAFSEAQPPAGATRTAAVPTPASVPATVPSSSAGVAASASALAPAASTVVETTRPAASAPSPAASASAPAASAPAPAAAADVPAAAPARQMTEAERRALEQARREALKKADQDRKAQAEADKRAQAAEEKRLVAERQAAEKWQEAERQAAEKEKERLVREAREQAKRDAETARLQQEEAKRQAVRDAEAARVEQEAARRQAEREQEQQKAVNEAAARLKAAEAAYQAELARQTK